MRWRCGGREGYSEQISGLGSNLANIFQCVGVLGIDNWQIVGLCIIIEGFICGAITQASGVLTRAILNCLAACCLQDCGHVTSAILMAA
jgi:hypothetical protein